MDKSSSQSEIVSLHRQRKEIDNKIRAWCKKHSDPEKNKKLYKIAHNLYSKVLDTPVNEDLNQKSFIQDIVDSLDKEESDFFIKHKHDGIRGAHIFESYKHHPIQHSLTKDGYIGVRILNKQDTLHQVLNCLVEAKIHQQKDILVAELKALKKKEALRYALFEQESFKEITDLTQKEFLLFLKSNPELSKLDIAAKLNIPKSTAYDWIKNFRKLGLLAP